MSNTITEAPEAGWYQDPNDEQSMRWWDGAAWTDHAQPIAPAEAEPAHETITDTAGGTWQSNYTEDELALYTGRTTELTAATTGRTLLEFTGTVPDWRRDRIHAQTGGVWMLAVSPLLGVILAVFGTMIIRAASLPVVPTAIGGISFASLLVVLFAAMDGRTLRRRGIDAPALAWILLGPVYLIVRAVTVRRSGGSGIGPLIVHLVVGAVVSVLIAIGIVLPVAGAVHTVSHASDSTAQRHAIEALLQSELKTKNGVSATVSCPEEGTTTAANSSFHCTATEATGVVHQLAVTVDQNGQAAYQLS